MHELTRRAYLDAMGIATYVSRAQMPGSAPTLKLAVVNPADRQVPKQQIAGANVATIKVPAAGVAQMPSVDLQPQRRTQTVVSDEVSSGAPDASSKVEFGVVALVTGRWLWLEELPSQQVLMRDQVELVRAMANAMGVDAKKPEVSQFHWPITTNNQLDLGEEAARGALGGFVNRKLVEADCRGVVILGSACEQWIPRDQLNAEHRILTISTAEMLRDPSSKKRAWHDLLPYVGKA